MDNIKLPALLLMVVVIIITTVLLIQRKSSLTQKLNAKFPDSWKALLQKNVMFYALLNNADKVLFEKRAQLFLATKFIEGVDTGIDDTIRLLVAASAIIPTFAFPGYNYPKVKTILIYPGSFNEKYQTRNFKGDAGHIVGMVDGRFQNGTTVILSKPDLLQAFDGLPHKENVGIHEFVHLLDKEDGEVDGVPEVLLKHRFVAPWLRQIKNEMRRIEKGKSDINPYAITSNAEFLAVVSEYFFDNPEKFKHRHPELYAFLSSAFNEKSDAPPTD